MLASSYFSFIGEDHGPRSKFMARNSCYYVMAACFTLSYCKQLFVLNLWFCRTVPRICAGIFCFHYLYRGWYFPLSIRVHPGASANFSVVPACFSWMITLTHAYLNARWYAEHGQHLTSKWLRSKCFLVGYASLISNHL